MKNILMLIAILGLCVAPAGAAYVTYSTEAGFLGDAGALNYESFENIASGTTSPVVTPNFTVTGDLQVRNAVKGGLHATDGISYVDAGTDTDVVFTFTNAINSFAFWFTDFGDFGTNTTLTFSNDGAIVEQVAFGYYPDGTDLFWGIIDGDSVWNQVTFSNSAASDNWSFDEVYSGVTGPVVPEPATLLLLGGGLFGGIVARRRKS